MIDKTMEVMLSETKNKPILVTGSHRSGTTWTGNMIGASKKVAYIQEPFNVGMKLGVMPIDLQYWFQFICDRNEVEFEAALNEVVNFRYPLWNKLKKCESARDIVKATYYYGHGWLNYVRKKRPLLKDPIAIFSAEWLYEKYDCDVIVLIRHPAAFCSSLKLKHWAFNFRNFLDQHLLMNSTLHPYKEEIIEMVNNEKSLLEQSVLLWNCIHHTILGYQERHKDWLFVKHEDLSSDPLQQFGIIYEYLNLDYTDKVKSEIAAATGSHNPIEQTDANEFIRNSRQNIVNWKTRLTEDEIRTIKSGTAQIAEQFYDENDW